MLPPRGPSRRQAHPQEHRHPLRIRSGQRRAFPRPGIVEGIDLYDYIEGKGQLAPEESRRILVQAVKALDYAYQQGIIHRDIKPSNFLLTRDRDRMRVKLTDMGLALNSREEEFRVTCAGSTVGTIDYLSPEQARNSAEADIRSDIYSLGCTFYHMLAGNPPFSEGGLGERILKHMQEEPPDIRQFNPHVSEEMWLLLLADAREKSGRPLSNAGGTAARAESAAATSVLRRTDPFAAFQAVAHAADRIGREKQRLHAAAAHDTLAARGAERNGESFAASADRRRSNSVGTVGGTPANGRPPVRAR